MHADELVATYTGGKFWWLYSVWSLKQTEHRFYQGVVQKIDLLKDNFGVYDKLVVTMCDLQEAWWPDPTEPTTCEWKPIDEPVQERTFRSGQYHIGPGEYIGVHVATSTSRKHKLLFFPRSSRNECSLDKEWVLTTNWVW